MGSLWCCLRGSEFDDEHGDWDSNGRNAMARLTLLWEAVFGRGGIEPMRLSYRGQSVSQSSLEQMSSFGSTSSSDGDGGVYGVRRSSDLFLTRREKGSCHSRVDPRPVSENNARLISTEEGSREFNPKMMVELEEVKSKFNIVSEDDEDVCPICLEEYTIENPRIVTKCSHHYHLSCIYEWNERSENCPVCSKLMVFEEMA